MKETKILYDLILPNKDTKALDDEVRSRYYLTEFKEDYAIEFLPKVNNVNVFIGANNSGKSHFMRFLLKNQFKFKIQNVENFYRDFKEHNLLIDKWSISIESISISTPFGNEVNLLRIPDDLVVFLENATTSEKNIQSNIESLDILLRFKIDSKTGFQQLSDGTEFIRTKEHEFEKLLQICKNLLENLPNLENTNFENKSIFIPTLRTLHSIFHLEGLNSKRIQDDIFLQTISLSYNIDVSSIDVFTGLSLYDEILKVRNSVKDVRKRFELFEQFLSVNFFNEKAIDIVAQIPSEHNKDGGNNEVLLIHIEGEDKTKKLYQIGDGIQALICLMYKIFLAEPYSIIYIDEPEINLHPGMQRLFLEQILRNENLAEKNLTYFISTHSNHFLDLTLAEENISIYSFSKRKDFPSELHKTEGVEPSFLIKNVNQGDNEILRSLGVNNSSVFLANCSIWVEGISDRNLVKAFLLAYSQENGNITFKEDIDFAFFEYAGSNRSHYNFDKEEDAEEFKNQINAFALNNRIYLIADSDCAEKGTAKFNSLKKLESINIKNFKSKVIWQIREIENILPNKVWEVALPQFKKKSNSENEKFESDLSMALKKINSADYKKEYIGKFLEEVNKSVNLSLREIWNKNGGTLKYKREFSEQVLNAVINRQLTWKDFKTEREIVTLVEGIHKFILNK